MVGVEVAGAADAACLVLDCVLWDGGRGVGRGGDGHSRGVGALTGRRSGSWSRQRGSPRSSD